MPPFRTLPATLEQDWSSASGAIALRNKIMHAWATCGVSASVVVDKFNRHGSPHHIVRLDMPGGMPGAAKDGRAS